jgi:hypothetical protein
MNDPKSQATMITWTRRSGEMLRKLARSLSSTPARSSVFIKSSAPNTM